jgi:RNA polymerase sigma factor (sigma-70 family)
MNLEQILGRVREDDSAFREIYDSTINRLYSYVLLRVKDRAMALDVCQDIYLSLWKSLPKFKYISEPHFYSFLFTVARRQLIKARAKMKDTVELDEIFDLPTEEVEKEDYRILLTSVQNLKDRERLCIELRYFKDLKFQEIAEVMNISENHAKVFHHRAMKKLRAELSNYE